MTKTEEIGLISRVTLFGDKKAFEKLIKGYQSPIRRFFMNLTMGDGPLSDDLSQETFIKAYLYLSSFKAISAFSTWLYRIAYNIYYDSVRARKYWDDLNEGEIDKLYGIKNDYSEEKADIYTALNLLRKEEKTAIVLFYMEDKTHVEIAKIMNCPLGTVKTYILKGKEKLSVYLTNAGYGKEK